MYKYIFAGIAIEYLRKDAQEIYNVRGNIVWNLVIRRLKT